MTNVVEIAPATSSGVSRQQAAGRATRRPATPEWHPDEEQFLADVSKHVMTIDKDDGECRSITYAIPGQFQYRFGIHTWPGFLCIHGDMGCYVFSRVRDMFEFFRGDVGRISPGYWAEKCQASDARNKIRQFTHEFAKQSIQQFVEDGVEELGAEQAADVRKSAQAQVLSRIYDSEYEVREALRSFRHPHFSFGDAYWEMRLDDYTYHYIWCCHAIVWGIQQYDNAKANKA